MTKQNWDIDKVKKEEIADHLQEYHSVSWKDRDSLNFSDFSEQHFPAIVKDLEDLKLSYLSDEGKKRIDKIHRILSDTLKFCEDKGIVIANIPNQDKDGIWEWRICEPTEEELETIKMKRLLPIIEGVSNKILLQQNMYGRASVNELVREVMKFIVYKQKIRKKIKIEQKQKKREKEAEDE